jgi:hypothetical protein
LETAFFVNAGAFVEHPLKNGIKVFGGIHFTSCSFRRAFQCVERQSKPTWSCHRDLIHPFIMRSAS